MSRDLAGRSVLVTGASAGIGAAVAGAFREVGAWVCGVDRSLPDGRSPACDSPDVVALDVTDRAGVRGVVERVASERGSLDVLVNCAGILDARDSFFAFDDDDWRRVLDVNTIGLFNCLQAAAEVMKARETRGAIVNIASTAGRNGRTLSPPYAASKAAVINLTRSAAIALGPFGIRVNAVAPGIINTAMNHRLGEQFGPARGLTSAEFVAQRASLAALGRAGRADEVAGPVLFLASSQSGYVTGQTLNVDGGMVMD